MAALSLQPREAMLEPALQFAPARRLDQAQAKRPAQLEVGGAGVLSRAVRLPRAVFVVYGQLLESLNCMDFLVPCSPRFAVLPL